MPGGLLDLGMWSGAASAGDAGVNEMIETQVSATTAATAASTSSPPTSSHAYRVYIEIGATPYSAGGTIAVGQTGSASLLVAAGAYDATVANALYVKNLDVAISNLPILVTIGGAPAAGTCVVVVESAVPLT